MKLANTRKIISSILLGIFSVMSIATAQADEKANASDPIANVAANTANTPDSNTNDNTPSTATADNNHSKASQDAIGNMLLQSVSLMGIAYKWGGNTPDTGMDCSGFVRYVFKKSLGINLPRTAAEMAKVGKRVNINELQPGDLIFFNTRRGSNTHIGIYLGGNKFIQSPRTGENIQISDLSGYWASHFNGAKRVVQEDQDDSGNTRVQSFSDVHNEQLPVSALASGGSRHARHASSHHGRKTTHGTKAKSTKKARKKKAH